MTKYEPRPSPRAPKPLDQAGLRALALHYVGRYATTTVKLRRYLERKLRERDWTAGEAPDLSAIIAHLVELGTIDDRGFGEMRANALASRGYGPRRIAQALHAAGLDKALQTEIAVEMTPEVAAATYARRRGFGQWDRHAPDPLRTRRQVAAMLRAGHSLAAARTALQFGGDFGIGGDDDSA